jgi:pentalenene oxygenase
MTDTAKPAPVPRASSDGPETPSPRTGATSVASSAAAIPPAPEAWPLLGHFAALRRDPLGFMGSLREHGDLVSIRLGPLRFVVVCDPGLAHQVFTDLRTFDRTGPVYDRVRRAMGSGVATATYADHRRQRLIMQPAFHARHLPGYAEVMRRQTAVLLDGWHDGDVVDMVEEMFRLTTSISLQALFSTQLDAADSEKLREAFEVFLRGSYTQLALPMLGRLPLPANRRYQAALRQWREQVRGLIARYRASGGGQEDLMARLLAARDDEGGGEGSEGDGLTDEELSDQVAVLLIAGGETTSAALTWAVYLLCTHPEMLAAATEEADRVLGGGIAEWSHLPGLGLTTRILQEAMRLYPPSWMLPRTATREVRLGRHVVPAGTMLLLSQYVLHHHPGVFPEPERFDPDRWAAPAPSATPTPVHSPVPAPAPSPAAVRQAYVPFGGGPTKCLGEQFASAEAVLALASMLTRWTPELPDPGAARRPESRLVLLPRRLPIRLTSRAR